MWRLTRLSIEQIFWSLVLVAFFSGSPGAAADLGSAQFRALVGAAVSDIGGGKELEPVVGIEIVREIGATPAFFCYGIEYLKKSGTGRVVDMRLATGEILYEGLATVELHTVQINFSLGYEFHGGAFRFAPYFGIAPVLVVNQSINPSGEAQDGAFVDYHAYKSGNVLSISGLTIRGARECGEIQASVALFDEKESESWHGTPLLGGSSMVGTYRFGLGIVF